MKFRSALTSLLFVLLAPVTALAGNLDLVVLQFPSAVEVDALRDALRGEKLAAISDGDRVRSGNSLLRGTPVLFAQTMTVPQAGRFATSTRLGNERAEVDGRIENSNLTVDISLSTGVEAPLRRFSRSVFRGSGPLRPGDPQILSIREVTSKQPSVSKGKTRMTTSQSTIALIYQFRR